MAQRVCMVLMVAALAAAAAAREVLLPTPADAPALFAAFKTAHARTYATPQAEAHARAAFEATLARIRAHNARFLRGETSFTRGINQFSDLTPAEFKARFRPMAASARSPVYQ